MSSLILRRGSRSSIVTLLRMTVADEIVRAMVIGKANHHRFFLVPNRHPEKHSDSMSEIATKDLFFLRNSSM